MQWLRRAQNWARFSSAASLGVVHKGHTGQAMEVLQPYLPQVLQFCFTHVCPFLIVVSTHNFFLEWCYISSFQ